MKQNYEHEEFTNQILNFLHTNLLVLGFNPKEIVEFCTHALPYRRQLDVLRILKLSIEKLREECLEFLHPALGVLL